MKASWKVQIPPPSAKRMAGNGTLIVVRNYGWEGSYEDKIPLAADQTEAEITLKPDMDWIWETSVSDGDNFDVLVEYKNATGTRSERHRLVPQRVAT